MTQVFGFDGVSLRARRGGSVGLRESLVMDMLSLECLWYTQIKCPEAGLMFWKDVWTQDTGVSTYVVIGATGVSWQCSEGKQNSNTHEPGQRRAPLKETKEKPERKTIGKRAVNH